MSTAVGTKIGLPMKKRKPALFSTFTFTVAATEDRLATWILWTVMSRLEELNSFTKSKVFWVVNVPSAPVMTPCGADPPACEPTTLA